MLELIHSNPLLVRWLAGLSLLMFVGTLLLVPYLITRIPADYFSRKNRNTAVFSGYHSVLRMILLPVKNIIGVVLVILGIAMLVLPGQGILTILMGLVLMDFPNKYKAERWLVSRKRVFKAINWFRHRAGKEPLDLGPDSVD